MSDTEKAAVIAASALFICATILMSTLALSSSVPKQECADLRGRPAFCRAVSP